MKSLAKDQRGFSIVELAMVVVIAGMMAAVAVPSLIGSKEAAENTAVISGLRAMHTNQIVHRSTQGRFARLPELNSFSGNIFGSVAGSTLTQKGWTYLMSPTPTNASLKSSYQIIAYKLRNGRIQAAHIVTQDGTIQSLVAAPQSTQPVATTTSDKQTTVTK